jgi:hypothetical protein
MVLLLINFLTFTAIFVLQVLILYFFCVNTGAYKSIEHSRLRTKLTAWYSVILGKLILNWPRNSLTLWNQKVRHIRRIHPLAS